MKTLNLRRKVGTANEAWLILTKLGLSKKTSSNWHAERYMYIENKEGYEIKQYKGGLTIFADGPKILPLIEELINLGVSSSPLISEDNLTLNTVVIYPLQQKDEEIVS